MNRTLPAAALAAMALAVPAAAVAAGGAPVIKEPFTPLPCPAHPTSTVALEGCAERATVRVDQQIDAVVAKIYQELPSASARSDLAAAQSAWLAFRMADCRLQSDQFAGGSGAGVLAGKCETSDSRSRLVELTALAKTLGRH